MVFEDSHVIEEAAQSCQSEDLEKPFALQVTCCHQFYKLWLAMVDLKLSAIFSAAVCMLPSRVRVIPRYLNSVTSSRGVSSFVKWESQSFRWRRPWLLFCQCSAWTLWNVFSHRICSVGVADFQPCLKSKLNKDGTHQWKISDIGVTEQQATFLVLLIWTNSLSARRLLI